MKITYKSNRLEKGLSDPKQILKNYGTMAKKVVQRLKELEAAANLEILRTIPAANCHELKGKEAGQLGVNISGNWRIVFEPNHDPVPTKEDGGLDWSAVTDIKILLVTDYH